MPVGYFDPDDDTITSAKANKKSREGKTDLQREALKATGRTYFKDSKEHKRFKEIEVKALGADDGAILHMLWIKHNISICATNNKVRITRTMGTLLSMCSNEIREGDWKATFGMQQLQKHKENAIANMGDDGSYLFKNRGRNG